jgi:hypothetical protein
LRLLNRIAEAKAFGHRIVPTVTFPTHALYNQWVFF